MNLRSLASVVAVVIFFFMAVSSAPSNTVRSNTFALRKQKTSKDSAHYIEFNDGTIVLGKAKLANQKILSYLFSNKKETKFKINDSIFDVKDVYGISWKGYFYSTFERYGTIVRVAGGRKLSIYFFVKVNHPTTIYAGPPKVPTYITEKQYNPSEFIVLAHTEDGTLKKIDTFDDLKELMKDCPYAVAILSRDANETKKDIRKNKYFLNDLVDMYNNGCK